MKKPQMTNYDFIIADFRYIGPPLEEICSKLKPNGTLLLATIEENIRMDPVINSQFEAIRIPLQSNIQGISVV